MFQGHSTQKVAIFFAKNGLKFPILGKKAVFWGLGAQFKTPLPYFGGA